MCKDITLVTFGGTYDVKALGFAPTLQVVCESKVYWEGEPEPVVLIDGEDYHSAMLVDRHYGIPGCFVLLEELTPRLLKVSKLTREEGGLVVVQNPLNMHMRSYRKELIEAVHNAKVNDDYGT